LLCVGATAIEVATRAGVTIHSIARHSYAEEIAAAGYAIRFDCFGANYAGPFAGAACAGAARSAGPPFDVNDSAFAGMFIHANVTAGGWLGA
jgi:hypothetical protein